MVSVAAPGENGTVEAIFGDGTLTQPGRYIYYCTIPIGIDPDRFFEIAAAQSGGPVVLDGVDPHYTLGMAGEIMAL